MPRRGAQLTQSDIRRAIAAARQAGALSVTVRPDGSIDILLQGPPTVPADDAFAMWEQEHEQAKAPGRRERI
jgi:hypothetical protein